MAKIITLKKDEKEKLCLDEWGIRHEVEAGTCQVCPNLQDCEDFD